ncbi:MAG: hypothetical protein AAFQ54_07020 [Pseudomonadota bacterium]
MKTLLFSLLACLTLVTSVAVGHARGAVPASDAVVICHGLSTTVIWLDGAGNEVERAGICPEAALSLFGQEAAPSPALALDGPSLRTAATFARNHAPGRAPAATQARGPPFIV